MNDQIRELAEQAKFIAEETINRQISKNTELDAFAEKFAELIVKECFRIVDDFGVEQTREPENYLGESLKVSMKITDAAWKIKEHFGIEE